MYELFEAEENIKQEIFQDFLYQNNQDFAKNISWQVIPYTRLKKIWEDYIRMGNVRDVKGLEAIERIAIRNALRINVITELAGHTSYGSSEEDIEENIGYWVNQQMNCILPIDTTDKNQLEIPYGNPEVGHNVKDRFFEYYLTDPKSGHLYITDYGLSAIMTQASKLYMEQVQEKKVVLIDSILNVVHQRSDMASWFVQGGSAALSNLSGYEIPDEEAGGYDTKSAISGRYKMADYN